MAIFALAGALFVGLTVYMRTLDDHADQYVREQLLPNDQVRPAAEVLSAIRSLKLVTVEVDSRVSRTATDQSSWRGDVAARVEAPVKLLYGVDLSNLAIDRVAISPVDHSLVVRVPPPERIATEVFSEEEKVDLALGWLRFRTTSGEFYLSEARKGLHTRARELSLPPDQAARIVALSREQLTSLLKKIVGDVPISIIFERDRESIAKASDKPASGEIR